MIFIHEFLRSKENNNITYTTCSQREKHEDSISKLLAALVLLPANWVLKQQEAVKYQARTQTQCLGWQGRNHWLTLDLNSALTQSLFVECKNKCVP